MRAFISKLSQAKKSATTKNTTESIDEMGAVDKGSTDRQDFRLRTAVADQHNGHFTRLLIHSPKAGLQTENLLE